MICAGKIWETSYWFLLDFFQGFPEGDKDTCLYDTGGPLVTKADVDAGYALIGVVSFGDGCGDPNKYGVSTEFSNYMDWVAQHFDLTAGFDNEERIRQKRSKFVGSVRCTLN